jgi:hypothetical protein
MTGNQQLTAWAMALPLPCVTNIFSSETAWIRNIQRTEMVWQIKDHHVPTSTDSFVCL